jgi:hypothetical protein
MSSSDHLPSAWREVLPTLQPSRLADAPTADSVQVRYSHHGRAVAYSRNLVGKREVRTLQRVPIVLCNDGSPWAEATLYLLDRAKLNPRQTSSLVPIANDLVAYRRWLDEYGFEWDDFNSHERLATPTYQYRAFLISEIEAGRISRNVARRAISTLLGFYRHLIGHARYRFVPKHAPWRESRVGISATDGKGFGHIIQVTTTDLTIAKAESGTIGDMVIEDGGKLRPLPWDEQKVLFAVLRALGNTEYLLMHLISILTGARLQTVLTLRLSHFLTPPSKVAKLYKLRCGPGTGIDTKGSKGNVYLVMAQPLYEAIHIYALSERAQRRQDKSSRGRDQSNYLFLTQQGNPFYDSNEDRMRLPGTRRTVKTGQALWDFINKQVIPEVRRTIPGFHYRFHDMRATFGLNWCDAVEKIEGTPFSYQWALNQLRQRMWHSNSDTTEKYLNYRHTHRLLDKAEEAYGLWMNGLTGLHLEEANT